MCGYSLEGHATRKAKVGDVLTTQELGEAKSIGFVSPDDPGVAVCLSPGATLTVTGDVPQNLRDSYMLAAGDTATFGERQVVPEGRVDYRDGLILGHARPEIGVILLQSFGAGLTVTVESVSAVTVPGGGGVEEAPESAAAERVLEPA